MPGVGLMVEVCPQERSSQWEACFKVECLNCDLWEMVPWADLHSSPCRLALRRPALLVAQTTVRAQPTSHLPLPLLLQVGVAMLRPLLLRNVPHLLITVISPSHPHRLRLHLR